MRLLALAGALFSGSVLSAQSVWLASPATNNFNTASNYSPAPNFGANPVLSFGASSVTDPQVTASVTLGSLTFTAGANAFIFGGSGTISITNATTNAVVLVNNGTALQTFNNPMAVIGTANGRWNAAAGGIDLAGGMIVNTANRNAFIGSSTGVTFTISGPVTGVAGIVKGANGLAANQGDLVLSNANNTFQGPLTSNAGTIILSATGAEGAATGAINIGNTAGGDNAAVLIGASGVTSTRAITVQSGSTGTMRLGGSSSFASGAAAFNGNVTLGTGVGKGVTFDVPGTAEITYGGTIQDIAGLSANFPAVTKVGTGTAILGGASTFQGELVINAGTVRLGAAERLRDTATVRLAGGNFATGGHSETLGAINFTTGATLDFGAGASVVTLGTLTRTGGTLTLANWSGNPGGGGTDRLIVVEIPSSTVLSAIQFAGLTGPVAALPVAEGYEIVPDTGIATPPVITGQPQNVTTPVGGMVTLSVTAVGSGALSYQWRRNGDALADGSGVSGATAATLSISSAGTGASGTYTVIVTNSVDSVTSDAAEVVVYGAPSITAQPESLTRDLGQSATFSVGVSSAVNPTYQWRKGGAPIAGATQSAFTIPVVTPDAAGNYDVIVTNPAGSTASAVATLTVSETPVAPSIVSQPASVTAPPGGNVSFTVQVVGTAPITYQWRRNGSNLANATAATLTLNAVTTANAGSYDVVVSNTHGSVTSSAANLLVLAGQTPVSAWRQMHPGGGGQVQGLNFDPNLPGRLYECSDVEGAYRSDDWGRTWVPIAEDLIHHMSFHIAVTPGDSNVIYCGTLYGIHKSTDAGLTWELILGGYANASWAFDPFDPTGKTWIAGRSWYIKSSQLPSQTFHPSQQTSGAFFVVRSTDAGETLTQHTYQAGAGTNQIYTVTYDPTRRGHVYIAGDAGLFRSRDGGETWENIPLPTGTLTRGADITPDGKWLYATVGTGGTLYVAAVNPTSTSFTWTSVHTNTTLLTAAGGNYWRPLVDPRSAIPVEQGGIGADQHRVIMGSFSSSANSNVGLVEGEFTDTGAAVSVNGWDYAFRRAGTAPGWNYEFGWNLIDPQCRQYNWMPRSWDNATPPDHISVIDATARRSRIMMASQQSVYLGSPDDPDSWNVLSSAFVRTQSTGGGTARFYRTRGFSSTVNFDMDGWETYYAQGMADNKLLESFDGGQSWTQDTVPGGRVGNGDAVLILRPRTAGETPVSLVATAPGAGGGADTAVGTLYRKVLTNMEGPTDPWVSLGALPLEGLASAPRIWYLESDPSDNNRVFLGTEGGLYYTDDMRASAPVFRRATNLTDSFKQGRIFVDPKSTATNVVLYFKTTGASRLYSAVGTRASASDPFTFTMTAISGNGTIRVLDDFHYWRRSSDAREFMAHTNSAEELWVRERADGETNWSAWTRVMNRARILSVKTLPWIDWMGRGVNLATQLIVPNLSSAPDAFTISGLGGHENSLIAAAWVEDGKHGYAMLRLDRNGPGDWTLSDWTGAPVPGSFDYHMGVARVWRSKVSQVTPERNDFLTASRGGGLWAREVGAPEASAPVITSGNTAHGVVNGTFSYAMTTSPVATAYSASALPAGLTLNSGTGVISGTPTAAGTTLVTLTSSNSNGTSAPLILEIQIMPGEASLTFANLDVNYDGSPKQVTVQTVPAGLSVNVTYNGSSTPPTAAGTYTVVATITDPHYQGSASATFVIRSLLDQWRVEKFGTNANTGPAANSADPDADGYSNLLEYALGLEPLTPNSQGAPTTVAQNSQLVFTFNRTRADLTYIVESSANLVDWNTIATNPGAVGQAVSVTDPVSLATSPRFLRLRVQP
jgi:autotransporter-associated beta strand protein